MSGALTEFELPVPPCDPTSRFAANGTKRVQKSAPRDPCHEPPRRQWPPTTRALLLIAVSLVVMPGCRLLWLIPHNHICPKHGPVLLRRDRPLAPPYNQQAVPAPVPAQTAPVAETKPAPEPSPTVLETLLAVRQEVESLRQDNSRLQGELSDLQKQTAQREAINQQVKTLMQNIGDDLSTVQNEVDAWRADLGQLRGRLRDQRTHHQQTLSEVEQQLSEMISSYETGDSESTTQ